MQEYVIYRNEGSDQRPVARVWADSPEEACHKASLGQAGDQQLSARPASEVDAKEQDLNRKVEAL